jgi:hypothetical protein
LDVVSIPSGQEFNFYSGRIPSWNGWVASIVLDVHGNHFGADGTSKSISNNLDFKLLMALRAKCDVIVTTGKTARLESYKASRFAPIAIISRQSNPKIGIPAFSEPGAFESILLESSGVDLDFHHLGEQLRSLGFNRFLFEGGPSTLRVLMNSCEQAKLVMSIAGLDHSQKLDAQIFAQTSLGIEAHLHTTDEFSIGLNKVAILARER